MRSASAFTPRTRLRGYEIGKMARSRGAYVIFGGIHATLYPRGSDGTRRRTLGRQGRWRSGVGDGCSKIVATEIRKAIYVGGQIEASDFVAARWDLIPRNRYMWASVQTVRGCPKHCSFCSVWRTDGQRPRQRASDVGHRGNRAVAAAGLSLHRAGRRQLLSRHPDRPSAWRRSRKIPLG